MTDENGLPLKITEEMGEHTKWIDEAKQVKTLKDLNLFFNRLTQTYEHDYGTICHAATAFMLAAFSLMDKSPQGGITGAQATFIAFSIAKDLTMLRGPFKIVDYSKLIYPQCENEFLPTIKKETFENVKKMAAENLANSKNMAPRVKAHMESIVSGMIPFGLRLV